MSKKPLYTYKAEVWGRAKCLRFSRSIVRDGMGTPHPRPGYLQKPHPCGEWGEMLRFNGGTIIGGEWYQSVKWPLPKVAKGFKWEHILSWGWYLVKT